MLSYGPAYTEIGQILLTNTETLAYEANWATNGLQAIAEVISEHRGYVEDKYGHGPLLTSNEGDHEFDNKVFTMRTYCWCDGAIEGHEDACPPNFIYKPSGFTVTWYKHAGRGITSNIEWMPALKWHRIVNRCIESVGK